MAWTDLSVTASGTPPAPRCGHGFASFGDSIYVHGGANVHEMGFDNNNGALTPAAFAAPLVPQMSYSQMLNCHCRNGLAANKELFAPLCAGR